MDVIVKILIFLNDTNSDYESVYYTAVVELLKNIRALPGMTIYKMAEICYVSPSTISRLVKMLGYGSFMEFKVAVASAIGSDDGQPSIFDARAIPPDAQPGAKISDYLDKVVDSLRFVQRHFNEESMLSAARDIHASKSVGFYFNEPHVALGFQRRLFLDGKTAVLHKSIADQLKHAGSLKEGDVIMIAIHNEREFADKRPILEKAKSKGVKVIVISSKIRDTYSDLIDHIFAFHSNDILMDAFFFGMFIRMFMIAYSMVE